MLELVIPQLAALHQLLYFLTNVVRYVWKWNVDWNSITNFTSFSIIDCQLIKVLYFCFRLCTLIMDDCYIKFAIAF